MISFDYNIILTKLGVLIYYVGDTFHSVLW